MKNARHCMMTLATVTALFSAQAMAAETFELQGERLAEVILGKAVPISRIYMTPVSVEQKGGPDIVVFPSVNQCFENPTGHSNFRLEIEAGLDTEDALDPNEPARVSVLVEDPDQESWTPNPNPPSKPAAAEATGWWNNHSSARAEISIDRAVESSFQKYVVARLEVGNSPKKICMRLDFSRGLGSVGIRSIRLVPVP